MRTFKDQLSDYGACHRERRNFVTHVIGVPMVITALLTLLSRPRVALVGVIFSPACAVIAALAVYYLSLQRRYGAIMLSLLWLLGLCGARLAAGSTQRWLWVSGALLVGGALLQWLGHALEGHKAEFIDDLRGFLTGPLYVIVELGFRLGWDNALRSELHPAERRK